MLPPPLNLIPTLLFVFHHWFWRERAIYEGKREIYKTQKEIRQRASDLLDNPPAVVGLNTKPCFSGTTYTISYPGTVSDAVVK